MRKRALCICVPAPQTVSTLCVLCRAEKEKQSLVMELDNVSSQYESVLKQKVSYSFPVRSLVLRDQTPLCTVCFLQQSLESRVGSLEEQGSRLKSSNDDLQRQLTEANNAKGKLQQETFEAQRRYQEIESQYSSVSKTRASLLAQVEELKKALEEEQRVRTPAVCLMLLNPVTN